MACFGPHHRRSYFGTDLKLTRQFRTMLSSAPGIAPPVNKSLRFLVIADPADDDSDLALPSATDEGEAVKNLLEDFKKEMDSKGGLDNYNRIQNRRLRMQPRRDTCADPE